MSKNVLTESVRTSLRDRLQAARYQTDELFKLIRPEALYERPIPERHRIAFYLGHLETFDWNMICAGLFELPSMRPDFDELFAFGIDPTDGNRPQDKAEDWPREAEIREYNLKVRAAVDRCLTRTTDEQRFQVAIEHRLMHAETLTYMLHRLPVSMIHSSSAILLDNQRPVVHRMVEVPAGIATLGLRRDGGLFGWDNEFETDRIQVPAFAIDAYKVTNADYLEFVQARGYEDQSLWSEAAWNWINKNGIRHPHFWRPTNGGFFCRTILGAIPFQASWPVYVSHAEADAYARWKGKSLPTEAQFHRAAFGTPEGDERNYPWGEELPQPQFGNFDFNAWNPTRVDAHPRGKSAFGVVGLVGNGWEWTRTPFTPFEGFKAFEFYPGYSANFFDGNHYTMKGGSARTAASLLRRSFRNFFQPLYPYTYTGFRCVDN